jgi:hypothetical protein
VPGSKLLTYGDLLVFVQIDADTGSPLLMIFAAAPVEAFVVPVSRMCDWPFGHLLVPVVVLYCSTIVVVPLPFLHVIFDVILPKRFFAGVVTVELPPADNPAGVHTDIDDLVVAFEPEIAVDAVSFEQTTLKVAARCTACGPGRDGRDLTRIRRVVRRSA